MKVSNPNFDKKVDIKHQEKKKVKRKKKENKRHISIKHAITIKIRMKHYP